MAVTIPTIPHGSQTSITIKTLGVTQEPYMGGPVQRVSRMGDKWSYEVQCRPMQSRQAGPFIAALTAGLTEKVLCPVRINGYDLTPYSDGTATSGAGRSLVHSGGGAAKFVGQFFSLVSGGVRYLHQIRAVTGANLTINPPLKVPIVGGEVLEFGAPKIEGFLEGTEQSWTIGLVQNLGVSFKIIEAQ